MDWWWPVGSLTLTSFFRISVALLGKFSYTGPSILGGASDMASEEPQTVFSFDLFKDLIGKVPSKNLLYSPFSVSSAMSMVLLGCNGKTKSELESTLRFCEPTQAHEKMAALQHALTGSNLQVANKLFIEKSFPVKEKFLNEIQLLYKSDVESKNFRDSPEASRKDVNNWVSKETHGKIEDLMPEGSIDASTKLVIANAIFFKGKWESQFKKSNTAKKDFHTISGEVVQVDMMTRKGKYHLAVDSEGKVSMIDIPYEGTPMSMVILLPNNDIREVENSLDAGKFLRMYKSLFKEEVILGLPKFKLQFERDLVQSFKDLGAKSLFSGDANFSGISDSTGLYVNAIAHKAFIEVDEQGTEAAAATGVAIARMALLPPTEFICNKPFLFFIYHKTSSTILFAGRMLNPTD